MIQCLGLGTFIVGAGSIPGQETKSSQTCSLKKKKKKERKKEDFPGGPVVKNPLSNDWVVGLILDQGTCHRAIKPECGN